jgi:uncharacterized protein (TIGR02996 family)
LHAGTSYAVVVGNVGEPAIGRHGVPWGVGVSEAELVAAVVAAPDDDGPRLVYADWLLDKGDSRGELVVAQCALERIEATDGPRVEARPLRERVRSLIELHREAWVEPLLDIAVGDYELRRGFVEHVSLMVASLDDPAELRAAAPLLRSIAAPAEACDQVLAAATTLPIDELVLSALDSAASVRERLAMLPRLRRLELRRLGEPPGNRDLDAFPDQLAHLAIDLAHIRASAASLAELARFQRLDSLALRNLRVSELGALDKLPALAALELDGGVFAAMRLPALPQLTSLAMNRASVDPLAMLIALPNLTRLRLTRAGLVDKDAIALAGSPLAAPLRRLDLSDNMIGAAGIRALVDSPHLQNLVELRVVNNPGHREATTSITTDVIS